MHSLVGIYCVRLTLVLSFILTLVNVASPQRFRERGVPEIGLVLENDYVRFEFDKRDNGLLAMIDKRSGLNHVQPGNSFSALWQLVMRAGTQDKMLWNGAQPATRAVIEKLPDGTQRAVLEWSEMEWVKEKGALTVRVTVDLPNNSGIAEWHIVVDNRSVLWSVWEVSFPCFTRFLKNGEYDIAIPENSWGTLYKNCSEMHSNTYPGLRWPVQLLCAEKDSSGVYLAAYDPGGRRKTYSIQPGDVCRITNYPENMGVPGNDYPDYFPYKIGVFQGGWLEAAKMYRAWALNQPWMSAGPMSKRQKTPDILKNIALWINYSDSDTLSERLVADEELLKANEFLNVPVGIHWYRWHHNVFDNEYPHYLPPKPLFKERVGKFQDHGIVTMPYINAMILDHDNYDITRFLPYTVKDMLGHPTSNIWWYGSGKTDWGCPSTAFWKNTVVNLVDSLAHGYGINAIYLDLIGAPNFLCFDSTHGHPLGGGRWWVDAVKGIISKVREIGYHDETPIGIIGENFSDVYMDELDGYLIWHKREDNEIPLHAAIYSGYTLFIGSPHWLEYGDRGFIACEGRDFLWGSQLGWMRTNLYTDPQHKEKAAYMKRLAQYRVSARKFLTFGEFMTMIEPQNKILTITEYWPSHTNVPQNATLPSAMGALWKAEDGSLGVFLVNFLEEENTFEFSIDPSHFGLPGDGGYITTIISPEGNTPDKSYPGEKIFRSEKLSPRGIKVIEINAKK